MYKLGTTRFNTDTWSQNIAYRSRTQHRGCIYGTPKQIKDDITLHLPIFILEMHNEKNKIMGIGLIRNAIVIGKRHNIYKDQFYNRYTYMGNYRIDRSQLDTDEKNIIKILEMLIFKGKSHLKRGQGITIVPDGITNSKKFDFIKYFRTMFQTHFFQKTLD